jgi:glycosyltransferase involved in cell wall biosynthesis
LFDSSTARRPFTFLFLSTNTFRKNPESLLEAFSIAFPGNIYSSNDVKLIMASTPPFAWNQLQYKYKDDDRIIFDYRSRTDLELRKMYHDSDCFVLPTRGEGFGLPILEALGTGLPIITTDFGGIWDFCNPDLCYLVRLSHMVQAHSPLSIEERNRGMLAQIDIIHLSERMKHVFLHQEEAKEKGKAGALEVKKNWSWKTVIGALFPRNLLCEEEGEP